MKRTTALLAVVLALSAAVGIWLATRWATDRAFEAGTEAGEATRKRLQLVWPDVLQMPDEDRLVLANLAMRCRLQEEPLAPQAVVQCLKRVARSDATEQQAALTRLLPPQYRSTDVQ